MNINVSPSRVYVAMCLGPDGEYYFKKFKLPELHPNNNTDTATWYFANCLDRQALVIGTISYSNYLDITDVEGV